MLITFLPLLVTIISSLSNEDLSCFLVSSKITCKASPSLAVFPGPTESTNVKNGCFESLGFVAAHSGGTDTTLTMCQSIPDNVSQASCITAAAGEVVFQDMPGWEESSGALCKSLPEEYKPFCDKRVLQVIQEYGRDKKQALTMRRRLGRAQAT